MMYEDNHSSFLKLDEGEYTLGAVLIRDEAKSHIALFKLAENDQPYTGPCCNRPSPQMHDERETVMGIAQCIALGLARIDFVEERILWQNPLDGDLVPWTVQYNDVLMEYFRGVRSWAHAATAERQEFKDTVEDPSRHMN